VCIVNGAARVLRMHNTGTGLTLPPLPLLLLLFAIFAEQA
jgi:hypothetical protein